MNEVTGDVLLLSSSFWMVDVLSGTVPTFPVQCTDHPFSIYCYTNNDIMYYKKDVGMKIMGNNPLVGSSGTRGSPTKIFSIIVSSQHSFSKVIDRWGDLL